MSNQISDEHLRQFQSLVRDAVASRTAWAEDEVAARLGWDLAHAQAVAQVFADRFDPNGDVIQREMGSGWFEIDPV